MTVSVVVAVSGSDCISVIDCVSSSAVSAILAVLVVVAV